MEKSRKKVRIGLLILLVVILAIVIGYYFWQRGNGDIVNDGTMINKVLMWRTRICP